MNNPLSILLILNNCQMVRHATTEDFDFIYGLYFHPQINPYLLYEMMETEAFKPIFADLLAKEIVFVFENNGQKVGMFKLFAHTHRTSHIAYLGGVAIHPDFAGKGFGNEMLEEILDLAQKRGFLRIELSTATINEKAIHLYEKMGFQKEGVLRNFCFLKSENRFLDEVMMAYLFE
jgi:L-phenylalanine/L-methionine N-acetyltransferase